MSASATVQSTFDIENDSTHSVVGGTLKSSIAQFFTDLFHGGPTEADDQPTGSRSMYEIGTYGSNNTAVMPGYMRGSTSIMDGGGVGGQSDYLQKLICQLTLSNSNMARQNELLQRRTHELDALLKDHVQHLNSIYYTMFCHGYSSLQFPDGEEVCLSQFRGALLNLLPAEGATYCDARPTRSQQTPHKYSGSSSIEYSNLRDIATAMKERHAEKRKAASVDASAMTPLSASSADSSFSAPTTGHGKSSVGNSSASTSSSAVSSADAEELKTAMLKCITSAKYDDMDEFVDWLSHDTPTSTQSHREERRFFNGPPTSYLTTNSNVKSRSLEDQLETHLRLTPSRQPPQLRRASRIDETAAHSASEGAVAPPVSSPPACGRPPSTSRALSESELKCGNIGEFSRESLNSEASSSRTVKHKTARLRAQSINSSKLGGLLLSVTPSAGGGAARRARTHVGVTEPPRKSLAVMRSPILTLGRAPPPKAGRNLI